MSKKTAKLKNKQAELKLASVILVAVFCLTLVNQGGFYEGAIAFAGILLAGFLFVKKINLKISLSNGLLFVFSVWYFLCSLINGFVTEYAVRGLLPFVLFLFSVYVKNSGEQKEKILSLILKFSLFLAVFAVIQCVVLTIKNGYFMRLLFPFNYSNTSGIYFAVCFFLCLKTEDKFLKKWGIAFAVATGLTLSVGAIALSVLLTFAMFIKNRKYKEIFIIAFAILISAFLLKNRILQSGGTFLERLLQIYDGLLCMAKNPIFGIGAGRWEYAKQIYQTGFYSARTLHSCVAQIGASSGIIGLLLFAGVVLSYLKDAFNNKTYFALIIILIVHSVVDFSFSFASFGFLLVLLSENEDGKTLKGISKYISTSVFAGVFLVSAYSVSTVKNFKIDLASENDFFATHSVEAAKKYAVYMNERNLSVPEDMFLIEHKPLELVLNEALSREDKENYLVSVLEKQPYNVKLMQFIEESCASETVQKARALQENAVASLSPLGEILYNLKGVNK